MENLFEKYAIIKKKVVLLQSHFREEIETNNNDKNSSNEKNISTFC